MAGGFIVHIIASFSQDGKRAAIGVHTATSLLLGHDLCFLLTE